MYTLEFIVNPVAKGRATPIKVGKFVRMILPKKTRDAQTELRWLMTQQWKQKPLEGALEVLVKYFFVRPKSVSEKKRPHMTVKPDNSNLIKAIEDAGNGVLWRDDAQIVGLRVDKFYSDTAKILLEFREIA